MTVGGDNILPLLSALTSIVSSLLSAVAVLLAYISLTPSRHSKHILILGPKCLMHFSAEVSETLRHQTHGAEMSWVRSVLGPKCPYAFTACYGELMPEKALTSFNVPDSYR